MDFIRTVYASMASRQIAFLLQRGRTINEAIALTSAAISFGMASNFCTVLVLFGWRPRTRIELMPIVVGFIVLTALERMNERLIRRWAVGQCERGPARWPPRLLLLHVFGSLALMFLVMYLMLWPQ